MLSYTSWIDIKTREIYDLVWVFFGGLGLIIALFEVYVGDLTLLGLLFPIVFSLAISGVLGYLGLFGGADVAAFITLSILHPIPPRIIHPALSVVSIVYPFTLFSNAALIGGSFSLIHFARNIIHSLKGDTLFEGLERERWWMKVAVMFTGSKINTSKLKGPPFQYPLEFPNDELDSGRRLILMPNIQDDDSASRVFNWFRENDIQRIWVSQTLPFIFFISIGYVVSLIFGDIALFLLGFFFSGF